LAIGVIFYVLPWMGLQLLETARAVAEFDLPGRVLGLWWGNRDDASRPRKMYRNASGTAMLAVDN
jgi:hypothetical protein